MKKNIYTYIDSLGYQYQVVKEIETDTINMFVIRKDKDASTIIDKISYNNIGEEYVSPFLSWYNVVFCSNNYGVAPDYDYMYYAVQAGKKTAATLDLEKNKKQEIQNTMTKNCEIMEINGGTFFVYHKGRLSDYFDYGKIKDIYSKHGIYSIKWDVVEGMFKKPLSYFGDENNGFYLHAVGGNIEDTIIRGLILGYPIESTVAFVR